LTIFVRCEKVAAGGNKMCVGCAQIGLAAAESVGLDNQATKAISIAAAVIMFASVAIPMATPATQVKAGAVCIKANQKVVKLGKTFVCKKSGKKLVWKVQKKKSVSPVTLPQAQPSLETQPSPTTNNLSYEPPSESSDNIENCKIKEVNLNGARNGRAGPDGAPIKLPSGFPRIAPAIQHVGNVKWGLIPIDFPDLKGDQDFRKRVDDQTKKLSDWYFTVSERKLKIDWSIHNNWITLPKETKNYSIEFSANLRDSANGEKLFKDAMATADPEFNFTNIQQVIFILPKGQTFIKETSQGFPWDKAVIDLKTNEGSVSGFSIAGSIFDDPGREYWSYWAHEFGHSIGLAHIGFSRGMGIPPFNPWDLMGGQDGPSRDLSGWLRFLIGWLESDRVYCKTIGNNKEIKLTLLPLNSAESGIKLAIVPLPSGKALVIESRRLAFFSCETNTRREGVIAYVYDPKLMHGEDFLVPITPVERPMETSKCNGQQYYNALTKDVLLRKADKVTVEGVTVEVLDHQNLDRILIKSQNR
jgi:M6 family metalloprotease-like protein